MENINNSTEQPFAIGDVVWADDIRDTFAYLGTITNIMVIAPKEGKEGKTLYQVDFFNSETNPQLLAADELKKVSLNIGTFIEYKEYNQALYFNATGKMKITNFKPFSFEITSDTTGEKITNENIESKNIRRAFDHTTHGQTDFLAFQNDKIIENLRIRSLDKSIKQDISVAQFNIANNFLFRFEKEWIFTEKINILLGKNAYGKTFLLRCLAATLQAEYGLLHEMLSPNVKDLVLSCKIQCQDEDKPIQQIEKQTTLFSGADYLVLKPFPLVVPLLAIPAIRYIQNSNEEWLSEKPKAKLLVEGAKALLNKQDFGDIINDMFVDIKDEYLEDKGFENSERIKILEKVFEQLRSHQEGQEENQHKALKFLNVETGDQNSFKIKVEVGGHKMSIKLVSQGILSLLSIFSTIYNFLEALKKERGSETEIKAQQAIVMIDEVDAHLHPTWQLKIVDILHDTFPNVQFIITAHSPLIVQNRKKEEVHYLTRTEESNENSDAPRTYTIHRAEKDLTEYSVFEILLEFFEMADKKEVEDYKKYYEQDYGKFLKLQSDKEQTKQAILNLRKKIGETPTEKEQAELEALRKTFIEQRQQIQNIQNYLHLITSGKFEVENAD